MDLAAPMPPLGRRYCVVNRSAPSVAVSVCRGRVLRGVGGANPEVRGLTWRGTGAIVYTSEEVARTAFAAPQRTRMAPRTVKFADCATCRGRGRGSCAQISTIPDICAQSLVATRSHSTRKREWHHQDMTESVPSITVGEWWGANGPDGCCVHRVAAIMPSLPASGEYLARSHSRWIPLCQIMRANEVTAVPLTQSQPQSVVTHDRCSTCEVLSGALDRWLTQRTKSAENMHRA